MNTEAKAILAILPPVRWTYKGRRYSSKVTSSCPTCGALAVVKLPAAILAVQPDDTTHVCLPAAGGCNQGFALDQ